MLTGLAAESAREASILEREGKFADAVRVYQRAIDESLTNRGELPGFICGRLAQLYRRLKRYGLEVELLERYHDSQTDDVARSRFHARLSKARTLAARHRESDCGALASVRAIKPPRKQVRKAIVAAEPSTV